MRRIKLTQGRYATVDDKLYDQLVAMGSWCYSGKGYACRSYRDISGKSVTVLMHLEVLRLAGVQFSGEVDHQDRSGLNNQLRNLRRATRQQNKANCGKYANNKSGFKGVCWDRGKWKAQIQVHGRSLHLGRFTNKRDAARAYDTAARKYFGDFACPNFKSAA